MNDATDSRPTAGIAVDVDAGGHDAMGFVRPESGETDETLADVAPYTQPRVPVTMPGEELAHLRKQAGLTQATLARQLGYSRSQVSRWESNTSQIPRAMMADILRILSAARRELDEWRDLRDHMMEWDTRNTPTPSLHRKRNNSATK